MPAKTKIRLVVADAHEIVRVGLKHLISRHQNLDCVGTAANADEFASLASHLKPDIAIVDLVLPLRDSGGSKTHLYIHAPQTKTLIFSAHSAVSTVVAALQTGALGYVSKHSHLSILIRGIIAVSEGRRFIDPQLEDPVLRTLLDEPSIVPSSSLTNRERQVLLHVAWGFTNRNIGANLGLSTKTVESYRARACEKLGLADRPAIVKFAILSGWLELEAG